MLLSDFAQMLYPYIGNGAAHAVYMREMLEHIADERDEETIDAVYNLTIDYLNRIYSGTRLLPKIKASTLISHLDKLRFSGYINDRLTDDAAEELRLKLIQAGIITNGNDVPDRCADALAAILHDIASGTKKKDARRGASTTSATVAGVRLSATGSYAIRDGVVYIDDQAIQLPDKLVPPSIISDDELPYISELYAAYAQAEEVDVSTQEDIEKLPLKYQVNFREQRENYYNAESVARSVREVFLDGEDDFNRLKDDTYDGVSVTCWNDYKNGFLRLIAVLTQASLVPLTKSYLYQNSNWIGNSERKGICHMLVNDGRLRWVIENE